MKTRYEIPEDGQFERVIVGEVMRPDTPNAFGDIYTPAAVKQFCYEFMRQGFGVDVEHDNADVRDDKVVVVESFIARKGDPDFAEGAWCLGMWVRDDELWTQVLDGELNGFSIQAVVMQLPIMLQNLRSRSVSGLTEPDPFDGHQHEYLVILNPLNQVISGGTGLTNGHSHTITYHSVTDIGNGHNHRFQVHALTGEEEESDGTGDA